MKHHLDLNLKLKQKLTLTPQMIQSIGLLQLSNLDLLAYVEKELAENPLLEGEMPSNVVDIDPETYFADSESPEYEWVDYMEDASDLGIGQTRESANEASDAKRQFLENALPDETESLYESIVGQLRVTITNADEIALAEQIAGYLTKDGYLPRTNAELAEELSVDESAVAAIVAIIQTLEPNGVGARDLKESLLLQLRVIAPENTLAKTLVEQYLERLSEKNYVKIAKELDVSEEEIQKAASVIQTCEPYPGRRFDNAKIKYVAPDLKIVKENGEWTVKLVDDFLPHLSISKKYGKLLRKESDGELKTYLSEKMTSAVSLIQAIEQRRRTLYKTGKAILELQRDFFDHGPEALKPLILRDVAEAIEMSESTVSRIANNKYLETVWGLFPIKYFFSVQVKSASGDTSKQAVKEMMKRIIAESPAALSDEKIREKLREKGVDIARRTVAKYRKELKIFSSRER